MKAIKLKPVFFPIVLIILTFAFLQFLSSNSTVSSEIYETTVDEVYQVVEKVYGIPGVDLITAPDNDQSVIAKDMRRGGMVELRWMPSTDPETVGYRVYRAETSVEFVQVTLTSVDTLQYIDTGLADDQEYVYQVQAIDNYGNWFLIGEVSIVPTLDITPPPVPGDLLVKDPGTGGKLEIQWSPAEAGDLAGYNLYRQYKENWQKVNDQPVIDCTFMDTAVVNGTVYHYRVSSIDDVENESQTSDAAVGWSTNQNARIIWQFGETGHPGNDLLHLYAPCGVANSAAGTYFIADTHNGRAFEISNSGEVIASDQGMIEPARIKPVNESELLIVDSGGSEVTLIDRTLRQTLWSFGLGKKKHGKDSGQLNNPSDATVLSNGNILIADTGNGRLLEVDRKGRVVWDSDSKSFKFTLYLPVAVQGLESGNILVTDAGLNKVFELTRKGKVVWSFGTGQSGNEDDQLDYPTDSIRLENGNTMIVDSFNYRILEISKEGYFIWAFGGRDQPDGLFEPTGIAWLPDNHILIADQHNHRIVKIDH